ncbi:MAG: hypothetical protein HYU66_07605 [Armatimonadetes bacterium]|nr:hypothetical protein [Armatimonadota bacterium]
MRRPIASRNHPDRVRRLLCVVAGCLAAVAAAQQRPLDNPAETFFDNLDTRLYVDSLPPRVTPPATWPPRLGDLLPQSPLFTEQREPVVQIDFDNYNMAANPQRLLYLEPEHLDLVPDDRAGQALRIDNPGTLLTGISRSLDPNQLAGRTLELSARVKLEAPYRQEDGAEPWFQPVVQMRWERPHPDAQKRLEGETLRTWDTIFTGPRGPLAPGTFVPDGRFHTYRCRLNAPEDLTGAMLQVVVQRCAATILVDDIALSLVGTRAERLFRQSAALRQGNLLGWRAAFDLGVLGGAVTSERRLSPLTDTANGRDFGDYRFVPGSDPRTAIALTARPGRSAALELPWLGLAAGQPYTMSLWIRADHDGTMVAFARAGGQAVEPLGRGHHPGADPRAGLLAVGHRAGAERHRRHRRAGRPADRGGRRGRAVPAAAGDRRGARHRRAARPRPAQRLRAR